MKQIAECGCGCGKAKGGCQKPEGRMAKHDAMECAEDAAAIADMIQDADNLPEWLEAKITLAADYMNRVKDYLTHYTQGSTDQPGFGGNLPAVIQPQFVPADFKMQLKQMMPERIEHRAGKWVVKPTSGDHVLGTHSTKKAALKQLAAIEIAKHRK
jgi:hypothetical protein